MDHVRFGILAATVNKEKVSMAIAGKFKIVMLAMGA
jgi:hypothetical protein